MADSILDRLVATPTDQMRRDAFGIGGVRTLLECHKTGATRPFIDRHEEWVLSLRIEQRFWANSVQMPSTRDIAKRTIQAELFRDVLPPLQLAMLCVSSGDRDGALAALGRISELCRG